MRTGSALVGLILIVIGGVFLLDSFGYVGLDWDVVWRLWPLVLVYLGLRSIFEHFGA